ncbi:MAG: ribose 5-phosphate isomerase B [Candidatus Diapherotrites archaeon]|uniref:Ribose 5-phosphate isomerase B n=1 Tax=Candidatus Iainarchaeum sp. TaxID=3101447 RepID=A0A8T3YNP6_9ARCH|nr:ribose 5-phosphate isomerase B [Candidatus Diapherotrites archaeon]
MRFYVGSDHAGFRTKEALKKALGKKGIKTIDVGTFSDESADYPDFALKVAKKVARDKGSLGLLVCGTGIGMSMAANKVKGIRAANPFDAYTARVAREHNDANVLCLGGRTYGAAAAKRILAAFLKARPSADKRHRRRVVKIMEIEGKC